MEYYSCMRLPTFNHYPAQGGPPSSSACHSDTTTYLPQEEATGYRPRWHWLSVRTSDRILSASFGLGAWMMLAIGGKVGVFKNDIR
jgi:hypothetical protein